MGRSRNDVTKHRERFDRPCVQSVASPYSYTQASSVSSVLCDDVVCDECYYAHMAIHQLAGDEIVQWFYDMRQERIGK